MAQVLAPQRLADAQWRRLERVRQVTFGRLLAGRRFDVDRAVQAVLAAQRLTVDQTDAYLSLTASAVLDVPAVPVGLDADRLIGARARRGRLLEDVYGGVAKVIRQDGFERGVAFMRQQITTDVALASREASRAVLEIDDGAVGYRRVLNPGGGKVCGLCVAAASKTYFKAELNPIHSHCRCGVQPIYDDSFVGRTLDRSRLEQVYNQTGGTTDYVSLSRVRIAEADLPPGLDSSALEELNALRVRVVNDPELGPMLDADRHDISFSL